MGGKQFEEVDPTFNELNRPARRFFHLKSGIAIKLERARPISFSCKLMWQGAHPDERYDSNEAVSASWRKGPGQRG